MDTVIDTICVSGRISKRVFELSAVCIVLVFQFCALLEDGFCSEYIILIYRVTVTNRVILDRYRSCFCSFSDHGIAAFGYPHLVNVRLFIEVDRPAGKCDERTTNGDRPAIVGHGVIIRTQCLAVRCVVFQHVRRCGFIGQRKDGPNRYRHRLPGCDRFPIWSRRFHRTFLHSLYLNRARSTVPCLPEQNWIPLIDIRGILDKNISGIGVDLIQERIGAHSALSFMILRLPNEDVHNDSPCPASAVVSVTWFTRAGAGGMLERPRQRVAIVNDINAPVMASDPLTIFIVFRIDDLSYVVAIVNIGSIVGSDDPAGR